LELAAAAHIRVAERSAYYALPESTRGIFVGGGGAVRIPRLIGTTRMIDMMLTGRTYSAEEGLSLGFSQYLVDDGHGLASFCRETPAFWFGRVSYAIKPGQTDGGPRHSPGILTRFSMRFREAPVGTMRWLQ
jgi:enoyl-CoA hydratase/carnithine racemase